MYLVGAIVLVALSYLAGSIPFSVLVARLTGGPDPRSIGSGRTGGTNALRALGRKWAFVVVTGDVLKGAVPVLVARWVSGADPALVAACGIAAVVGSARSIFLRFHGGRGVGTGVGTMLVIQPMTLVVATPIFVIVILVTRYVSLGSLLGSASMIPATALIFLVLTGTVPAAYLVYAVVGVSFIWVAHADNIERLIKGTERKFDLGLISGKSRAGG
jgi:glycerol-3-phosphate acyltransferase PlsY